MRKIDDELIFWKKSCSNPPLQGPFRPPWSLLVRLKRKYTTISKN